MTRLANQKLFSIHLTEKPNVYKMLRYLALREKRRGRAHTSIRKLWEMARDLDRSIGGLDDHLHAHYARYLMANNPELDGLFYTRRLRAA